MVCDGVAFAIEDEEASGSGSLVDAPNEPLVLDFLLGFHDAGREMLGLLDVPAFGRWHLVSLDCFGVATVSHCARLGSRARIPATWDFGISPARVYKADQAVGVCLESRGGNTRKE